MMNKLFHMPLKVGETMRTKCPCTPGPTKQKNEINHAIKTRLANTITNIFPSFKPTCKKVLGLLNNSVVTVDECLKTTYVNSKQKSKIHMQENIV